MYERTAVAGGIVGAVLSAGIAAAAFDSPETLFGLTPFGAALYPTAAVALPQVLLARRDGPRDRVAVAVLGVTVAATILRYGVLTATLFSGGGGLTGVLLVGVALAALVGAVRAFRDGYAAAGS